MPSNVNIENWHWPFNIRHKGTNISAMNGTHLLHVYIFPMVTFRKQCSEMETRQVSFRESVYFKIILL